MIETEETKSVVKKKTSELKVFLTGGTGGVGRKICEKYASEGATVYFSYLNNEAAAKELENLSGSLAGNLIPVKIDLNNLEDIKNKISDISDFIDVVIFNAVNKFKMSVLLEQSLEDFEEGLNFGVRGPFVILKELLPRMIEQGFGRVISILSTTVLNAPPANYSSYNVNKQGLHALAKSIAVEYGKHNITSNMISPDMLRTELTERVPERMKKIVEAQSPMRRLADLEEVADTVLYLSSDKASYINGQNIVLSGGKFAN